MITLIENDISLEEYLTLREKVGWKKLTDKQAAHALANCLYKVKAVDADGQVVGMGRCRGLLYSGSDRDSTGAGTGHWLADYTEIKSVCGISAGRGKHDDAMSDVCQGQRAIL